MRIRERYKNALEGVNDHLKNYDRSPFLNLLGMYLELFPSPEALEAFAERYPDKYLMGLHVLARTAGFTDKTEATVQVNVNVRTMSDSQLEDRLARMASELGIEHKPVIDVQAESVGNERSEGVSEVLKPRNPRRPSGI